MPTPFYPFVVPPQEPVEVFFNPNKRDRGLVEYWNTETAKYKPLDIGAPHPNTRDFAGFRLGIQTPVPNNDMWIKRVWVTDETNPDWFNYEIKYAEEANNFPTFIRQYREDKKTYVALPKAAPLSAVVQLKLSTPGTGYTPDTFPAVTFSGGGGTGASGHAIVNLDGTIAEVTLDDGGIGYTSVPNAVIDDPPIGVTATALAVIQPQTAYLTAEKAEEFPKDSEFFGLFLNVTRVYETLPGPILEGEQTGKWGVEPTEKQRVLLPGTVDEGYLVRESKVDPETSIVGQKTTVFYRTDLYGVALPGQDYDPRLDAVIPYITKIQPISYGIGVNRQDITPIDYEHADVRTIDPAIVQAVLDAYVFSYPGRINVDMPDLLTGIVATIQSNTSEGADSEIGSSTLTGNGSIAQTLTGQAQASANILPEAWPLISQFWGNNIACQHYHFFLPNPVTLADVTAKLNGILDPDTVSDWPKFNPELVTLLMAGGRVSVQAKAHSQGSYALSGTGTASTAAGGTGYSEERGLTIKTLRISPTIHDEINVAVSGDPYGKPNITYGKEEVTATAHAFADGLGPPETQVTGPISVPAFIYPTIIPATTGATTWPATGLFLYRTDPHPYRYGYIEFHCVVVDAADFPNVP